MKNLVKEYLNLPYTIKLIPEDDGTYYVYVEELPGCASMGDTPEEAMEKIREAMEGWIESNLKRGLKIPLPQKKVNAHLPRVEGALSPSKGR